MKLSGKLLIAILLFTSLFLSSCGDDNSTNPTDTGGYKLTCVVNGGPYSNQTFTYDQTGVGMKNPTVNVFSCTFVDAASNSAGVTFEGTSTGTYTINNSKNIVMLSYTNNVIIALTSGSIKVTKIGAIGSDILGTFTGSGQVVVNGTPYNVEISKGSFKAKRVG